MRISVDVPETVGDQLVRQARQAGVTPGDYAGQLLREGLRAESSAFSEQFLALAGSWEDSRTTDEIIGDIEESRVSSHRPELR